MEVSGSAESRNRLPRCRISALMPALSTEGEKPVSPIMNRTSRMAAADLSRRKRPVWVANTPHTRLRCRPDTTSRWEMPASR